MMTIRAEGKKTKPNPHGYDHGEPFKRGYWWSSKCVRYKITKAQVWFCCPECSGTMSLKRYAIDTRGRVAPTVVCPRRACGFAEDITLNAWQPMAQLYYV